MFFPYLPNSATIDCYEYGEIHHLYFFYFFGILRLSSGWITNSTWFEMNWNLFQRNWWAKVREPIWFLMLFNLWTNAQVFLPLLHIRFILFLLYVFFCVAVDGVKWSPWVLCRVLNRDSWRPSLMDLRRNPWARTWPKRCFCPKPHVCANSKEGNVNALDSFSSTNEV